MAWIDDRLRDHPKVNRASPNALKYWLFALTYCSQYGTSGQLDDAITVVRIPAKYVTELVEIGLWDEDDDGLWVHDWQEHNDKRDEAVEQKRKAARERQQRHREKIRSSRSERDTSRKRHAQSQRDKRDRERDTERDVERDGPRGRAPARAGRARPNDHDQEEETLPPSVPNNDTSQNGRTDGHLERLTTTDVQAAAGLLRRGSP